ncbi:MAG: hypothetical protein ACRD6X_02885 [Pyrinomonadaceae bacterium]
MWEKLLSGLKDFILQGELTRRNADDIRELRKRNEEITILVERLAFEIQRVRENEAHEREKLLLRLELESDSEKKQLQKKKPR